MKILLLCYWFPPIQNAATHRPLTWVRRLNKPGWTVKVVTTEYEPFSGPCDHSLAGLVPPGVQVRRTEAEVPQPGFPDPYRVASYRIARLAEQLADEEKPDLIVSTSYPYSLHLEAGFLAHRLNIPWISDFRDLWADNPVLFPKGIRGFVARRLEAWILRRSAATTVVSNSMKTIMLRRNPRARIEIIRNAVEPEDLPKHHPPEDRLRIVWAGSFYGPRTPVPFLEAFADVSRISSLPIEVLFLGPEHPSLLELPMGAHYLGMLPWCEAMRILATAHVALIENPSPENPSWITRKIYEALAIGLSVLAGAEVDSDLAELVRSSGGGWVVPPIRRGYVEGLSEIIRIFPKLPRPKLLYCASGEVARLASLCEEIAR